MSERRGLQEFAVGKKMLCWRGTRVRVRVRVLGLELRVGSK